jgi:hypothetical protein
LSTALLIPLAATAASSEGIACVSEDTEGQRQVQRVIGQGSDLILVCLWQYIQYIQYISGR